MRLPPTRFRFRCRCQPRAKRRAWWFLLCLSIRGRGHRSRNRTANWGLVIWVDTPTRRHSGEAFQSLSRNVKQIPWYCERENRKWVLSSYRSRPAQGVGLSPSRPVSSYRGSSVRIARAVCMAPGVEAPITLKAQPVGCDRYLTVTEWERSLASAANIAKDVYFRTWYLTPVGDKQAATRLRYL